MNKFLNQILLAIILVFSFQQGVWACWFCPDTPKVEYCQGNECGLKQGISVLKTGLTDIITDRSLSKYVQDIVAYLLMFISIIAVVYIMYAGFQIMIWGGEEDKIKKAKDTIRYVVIGIVVIWLAYSIVLFIMRILNLS